MRAISLDSIGRITDIQETVQGESKTFSYAYDISGRLIHVYRNDTLVSSYDYDSNGNRTSFTNQTETFTGTCDNQDRMLTYGDASYGYNKNGSLTFKAEAGDTTFYNYDNLGNLISVRLPDDTFIEYIIDGQNRRIGKVVNGTFQKGWLYQDQLNPVAELDASGNVVARFVYGSKGHVPDYMVQGDSTYRIISDHLGSVRFVINAGSGTIAQQLMYDEFGNVLTNTNPDFQPFAYAGGLYDEQTGLVRFGSRDYDAEVGRWTAKDPIGFEGDLNFYVYCHNSPVIFLDPTGQQDFYNDYFKAYLTRAWNAISNAARSILPNAYTLTLSGSSIVGGGLEVGIEFVYIPGKGVYVYLVVGGGTGISISGNLQFGAIWNLQYPKDYDGFINEIQGSYAIFGATYSWLVGGVKAVTVGGSFGPTSLAGSGAYVAEHYIYLCKL